jgi:hypothetical protein
VLLGTSMMHLHFEDSHLKILDSRVKFSERFNSRVGGYTYSISLAKKACSEFMLQYLVFELSTQ